MASELSQNIDSHLAKDLLVDLDVGVSETAAKPQQHGLPDSVIAESEPLVKSEHVPLIHSAPERLVNETEPPKKDPEPPKNESVPFKQGPLSEPALIKDEASLLMNEPEPPVKFEPETSVKSEPEPPVKNEPEPPIKSEPKPPVKSEPELHGKNEPESLVNSEFEPSLNSHPELLAKGELESNKKSEPIVQPQFESTLTSPSGENVTDVTFPERNDPADELLRKSPSPEMLHEEPSSDPLKVEETFGFNKPLPPEPHQVVSDFLKSETNGGSIQTEDKDDELAEFVGARGDYSPNTISREESPIPPPVPKHQNLRDESPDRFESSPEPDFKPLDSGKEIEEPEPPSPIRPTKPNEPKKAEKEEKQGLCSDIGAKDIIVEIDAWFNPARLHPQVESLVYWRDPRKSGAVFGVLLVTLLSLTTFSLISVIAYFGLIALVGTISFRVYKNIMQAVQKTSDGHPFKELLQLEISLPEDKVAEVSRLAAQQLNAAISALRSLFLVEDLIDSIKGLVLFWALTYVGALFNGLTLLIIGVILVFALPRLYEMNKDQVDAYIQIVQDKLSIITTRMKAAIPSAKKEEKPKDQ